jgi:hypothetical protein
MFNYNEFKSPVRWHDYVSVIIHEFPILLIRRYDWMDDEKSTLLIQVLGVRVHRRIWTWPLVRFCWRCSKHTTVTTELRCAKCGLDLTKLSNAEDLYEQLKTRAKG